MADITALILDDHETFRRQFAALDELQAANASAEELGVVWQPLADLLDVHAEAEETIFYPQLLRRGSEGEDETDDAIRDHNDIRDGVAAAREHEVGTDQWWQAVGSARTANSEHMAEEEREALADFRQHADPALRDDLGRQFLVFKAEHRDRRGLDVHDKDPKTYIKEHE